jgi:hypothetical protein
MSFVGKPMEGNESTRMMVSSGIAVMRQFQVIKKPHPHKMWQGADVGCLSRVYSVVSAYQIGDAGCKGNSRGM